MGKVRNPLPNHLHVPGSIRAPEAEEHQTYPQWMRTVELARGGRNLRDSENGGLLDIGCYPIKTLSAPLIRNNPRIRAML